MSDDYLWNKTGKPDPEVERLEGLLRPLKHDAPLAPLPAKATARRASRGGGNTWLWGGLVAAAAGVALWFGLDRPDPQQAVPEPIASSSAPSPAHPSGVAQAPPVDCSKAATGFAFEGVGGPVSCGGRPNALGNLPVGVWLETPKATSSKLAIADIGTVTLSADSRLRIVKTGPSEHRLELTRGHLAAKINAPAKHFVIETPAATAVDLGCAYELWIDLHGRTHLKVTSGAVALEAKGRSVFVPKNALAVADPTRGPGTPVAFEAKPELIEAASKLDQGSTGELARVLERAELRDSVTLYSLLQHAAGQTGNEQRAAREAVAKRLAALGLVPRGVTVAELAAGDATAIALVHESLMDRWFPE